MAAGCNVAIINGNSLNGVILMSMAAKMLLMCNNNISMANSNYYLMK
jgi:hypothetical protein